MSSRNKKPRAPRIHSRYRPDRATPRDDALKGEVYRAIQDAFLRVRPSDRPLTEGAAKQLFDEAIDALFAGLIREPEAAYFRLPLGYGILQVRKHRAMATKFMPTRENLPIAPIRHSEPRYHVKYREGSTVKRAFGTFKGRYIRKNSGVNSPTPRALIDLEASALGET